MKMLIVGIDNLPQGMEVNSLRQLRGEVDGVGQVALAQQMEISQARVSQLESGNSDPRISTIERYVQALGGELHLVITFPAQGKE